MRKSGFTIAEFVISVTMMFVVMGAVVSIPFKKAKQTKNVQLNASDFVCSCSDNNAQNGYCDFSTDNSTGRFEFFEVTLIGGGAAAGPHKGGGAGEVKRVLLPTMHGNYRIQLGAGGTTANRNGGNTALYVKTGEGASAKYELLEYAMGGLSTNEEIFTDEHPAGMDPADYEVQQKTGGEPGVILSPNALCGRGGDAGGSNTDGIMGGAAISW